MSAQLLEGRPVAQALWEQILARIAQRGGDPPLLAMLGGTDPASQAYARQIERQFTRHGLATRLYPAQDLVHQLQDLNRDPAVHGVLLLTPLPEGIDLHAAVATLDPCKDVDGQHPANLGRLAQRRPAFAPATALGGRLLLEHYAIELRGRRVVVLGRSPVVGLPLALLLLAADATVTICHSRSTDLPSVTREADVLCVAVGRRGLVGPEHVKPGAVVVDFGTHPDAEGGMHGDVQTQTVAEIASAITPVPGGTGPITVAALALQTVQAAENFG